MGTRGKESKPNSGWRIQVHYFKAFLVVCGLMVVTTLIYFACVAIFFGMPKDGAGFGDMFGGLSSVFAGLAFAGVLITVIMQQEELRETREELRKSAIAQDESQKALNNQLRIMEISTTIDVLGSYTNVSHDKNDLAATARMIMRKLVLELINEKGYTHLLDPNFHLLTDVAYGNIPNPQKDSDFYTIKVRNHGGGVWLTRSSYLPSGWEINSPPYLNGQFFFSRTDILELTIYPFKGEEKMSFAYEIPSTREKRSFQLSVIEIDGDYKVKLVT